MRLSSQDLYKGFLVVLFIVFVSLCANRSYKNKAIDSAKECLNKLDIINSGTQRLSKLELENSPDDELIKEINYIICYELFLEDDIGSPNYFENDEEMTIILQDIFNSWFSFYNEVLEYREKNGRDRFFTASENEYIKMNIYLNKVQSIIEVETDKFVLITNCIVFNLVLIGLIIVKFLLDTLTELKKNKELSKDMYIDTSTGLYNGSKCQEILKNPNKQINQAIIICDLNGLKKTNDNYGHRAGDQLIFCFATELKKATNIFTHEVFVGRYGGDEFMVALDDVEELEIKAYINEVNFLMEQFNKTQNKPFKLSCAIGYSISKDEDNLLTKKELFDLADENMYKNKIAMKKLQNGI
ncbi:MAG: GGDEF domain-containing protein [bacterium]